MLHLLPSVLFKKIHFYFSPRRVFLVELLLFVFFSHLAIFGLMILVSSLEHKPEQFSISLSHTGQTYVLMPLSKKVSDFQIKQKKGDSGLYKKSKVIDYETYQKHKKRSSSSGLTRGSSNQMALTHKKVSIKKNILKKSDLKSNKKASTKSEISKTLEKKEKQAVAKQASLSLKSSLNQKKTVKAKPKAIVKTRDIKPSKINMKKTTVALPVAELKQPEQEKIEQEESLSKVSLQEEAVKDSAVAPEAAKLEIVAPEVDLQKIIEPHLDLQEEKNIENKPEEISVVEKELDNQDDDELIDDDIDLENVVFLGRDQFDNSIVASKLKQAVEQCWTSPVGIKKGTICQMRVHINQNGSADEVKIVQSSKIIMYDLPARKALLAMKYPKEVWNKTITIALGA